MDSGVATRPINDFGAYVEHLTQFIYKTNLFMKPVFSQAKSTLKRIVFAEGEEERVLHATQEVVSQHLAFPILIGRPSVIEMRLKSLAYSFRSAKTSKWSTTSPTLVLTSTGANTTT